MFRFAAAPRQWVIDFGTTTIEGDKRDARRRQVVRALAPRRRRRPEWALAYACLGASSTVPGTMTPVNS